MPCCELFDIQSPEYKNTVLGNQPRIAVEAASDYGWRKYVGDNGEIIALTDFGASGPSSQVYEYFGITVEHIISAVKKYL